MKCRSWSCRRCVALLAAIVYFLCGAQLIVNAESAETILSNRENDEYQSEAQVVKGRIGTDKVQVTHSKPKIVDGIYYTILSTNGERAYCLQSSKNTPEEAVYEVEEELSGADSFLNKVMYYAYGNPGYREELWISDCPGDTERAYLRSHMVLSYVYDSANTLKREIMDDSWKGWWQNYIQDTILRIQKEPDIPDTSLSLEKTEEKAYFDLETYMQCTETNRLYGDSRNEVNLTLPSGVFLVNETKGSVQKDNGSIWGGDSFYFMTDVSLFHGEKSVFDNLQGSIQHDWVTLVVQTGQDTQHLGYGVLYGIENKIISIEIEWLPNPELKVDKYVDDEMRVYRKGEYIDYHLEVSQIVKDAVAKNVVIEDEFLTEGIVLQFDSIRLRDSLGNEITDAVITETEKGFVIQESEALEYLLFQEGSAGIYVDYRGLVQVDEARILKNRVTVRSENTPDDEDEVEVPTEKTPEEIEKPKVNNVPKTGDHSKLIVLILNLLLSCVIIMKYGRIAHRK